MRAVNQPIVHDDAQQYIILEPAEYFHVNSVTHDIIMHTPCKMDLLGQIVFYRTYSRQIHGKQETWNDVVLRVVEGVMTIRKNWFKLNHLLWDESKHQDIARMMADEMLNMHWSPPGRGLWAIGTDQMLKKGATCLYNCGAVGTTNLKESMCWAMNHLMLGVGVGFKVSDFWKCREKSDEQYVQSLPSLPLVYTIDDSREGWVDSVRTLFESYQTNTPYTGRQIIFNYSQIREKGAPLKYFGGISGGPEPLKELHEQLRSFLNQFVTSSKDEPTYTRFAADCINALGACVVAGNIRRSAEILLGDINSRTFLNLKNLDENPDRSKICYFSNNSIVINSPEDVAKLHDILPTIIQNGEPGIVNMYNAQKYKRYGEVQEDWDESKGPTDTMCTNPCGEIPLKYFELCNLADVNISKCSTLYEFKKACRCACFYCSTVNLLKTSDARTNEVIAQNRRIGVSLSGICDFIDEHGVSKWIEWMKEGYDTIKEYNKKLADEAGVRPSIAITTIKPSGSVSLLSNVSPGIHPRLFKHYIRRIRIGKNDKIVPLLTAANIPYEDDLYTPDTLVFEIPVTSNVKRTQHDYSIWEQMQNISLAQRYFVDNMISVTITFSKQEESELLRCIESYIHEIKGVSFLPQVESFYKQMPFEGISEEEYTQRRAQIQQIDWSKLHNSDGIETMYCDSEQCKLI